MDTFDFSILSLNDLDMPEDVIIDYSHITSNSNTSIRSNSNPRIITQEDRDFVIPILLRMREILSRY